MLHKAKIKLLELKYICIQLFEEYKIIYTVNRFIPLNAFSNTIVNDTGYIKLLFVIFNASKIYRVIRICLQRNKNPLNQNTPHIYPFILQ